MLSSGSGFWLMTKHLIELDDDLLAAAQTELNTTGVSDTVRTALRQAVAKSARAREVEWLRAGGLTELSDPDSRGEVCANEPTPSRQLLLTATISHPGTLSRTRSTLSDNSYSALRIAMTASTSRPARSGTSRPPITRKYVSFDDPRRSGPHVMSIRHRDGCCSERPNAIMLSPNISIEVMNNLSCIHQECHGMDTRHR